MHDSPQSRQSVSARSVRPSPPLRPKHSILRAYQRSFMSEHGAFYNRNNQYSHLINYVFSNFIQQNNIVTFRFEQSYNMHQSASQKPLWSPRYDLFAIAQSLGRSVAWSLNRSLARFTRSIYCGVRISKYRFSGELFWGSNSELLACIIFICPSPNFELLFKTYDRTCLLFQGVVNCGVAIQLCHRF